MNIKESFLADFFTLNLILNNYLLGGANIVNYKIAKCNYKLNSYVAESNKLKYFRVKLIVENRFQNERLYQHKVDNNAYMQFFKTLTEKVVKSEITTYQLPSTYLVVVLCRLAQKAIDEDRKEVTLNYYQQLKAIKFDFCSFEKYLLIITF